MSIAFALTLPLDFSEFEVDREVGPIPATFKQGLQEDADNGDDVHRSSFDTVFVVAG